MNRNLLVATAPRGPVLVRDRDVVQIVDAPAGRITSSVEIPTAHDFALLGSDLLTLHADGLARRALGDGAILARMIAPTGARRLHPAPGELGCGISGANLVGVVAPGGGDMALHVSSWPSTPTFAVPLAPQVLLVGDPTGVYTVQLSRSRAQPARPIIGACAVTACALGLPRAVAVITRTDRGADLHVVGGDGVVLAHFGLEVEVQSICAMADGRIAVASPTRLLVLDVRRRAVIATADGLAAEAAAEFGDGELLLASVTPDGATECVVIAVHATARAAELSQPRRTDAYRTLVVTRGTPRPLRIDASPTIAAPDPVPIDEVRSAARALIEDCLCHTALVIERLLFLTRNLGLLPRTSSEEDPLAPLVITDSDVATILAGFRKIEATPVDRRRGLLDDPHAERLLASRRRLRERLRSAQSDRIGVSRVIGALDLDDPLTDMFLLALGPELDLRIARLLGFLNNDVAQSRPRFGHLLMAGQMGLPTADAALIARAQKTLFDSKILLRDGLPSLPLAAQPVRVNPIVSDLSVTAFEQQATIEVRTWAQLRWAEDAKTQLRVLLLRELRRSSARRIVAIEGLRGSGRLAMAKAAAHEFGKEVEHLDISQLETAPFDDVSGTVVSHAVKARVLDRVLVIRADGAVQRHTPLLATIAELIDVHAMSIVVLVRPGELEAADPSVKLVRFEPPRMSRADRLTLWQEAFAHHGLTIAPNDLDDIAGRFDCPPGRVWEVSAELAFRRGDDLHNPIVLGEARETWRDLTVQRFRSLAKRYESSVQLDDLVFPQSVIERLEELVYRIRYRHRVFSNWAFADKAHESYGVSALFVGPPGTGKTAAAAAIARALEIDLYIVDFSAVMSKWVGETEQNLAKIFDEAESSSVALLFDEADALFGKRTSTQESSSDRYANITVNYLLQRMESFSGLAILTTNLESAMDEAFSRRITAKVQIPETDEQLREILWRHMLPAGAVFADDVDLGALAASHEMQGAHIRRALVRAAFRVAASGSPNPVLTRRDVEWAAAAEYADMGRLSQEEGGES